MQKKNSIVFQYKSNHKNRKVKKIVISLLLITADLFIINAQERDMEKLYLKLKTPLAVILLLILAGGAFSYKNLKTSLFPNVTFPKIKIIADNGEQPVNKMMIEVTKPIEDAIKRVEHLSLVRSATTMGSCEISAYMEWGSDIDLDKQQVESHIALLS